MTAPVLTKALSGLRTDFTVVCPRRDTASDGWIGDKRHQLTASGHNPDDTPGSKAESSDADNKPEVRAVDIDKDLRTPGLTMQMCINKILESPNDLKRLRYIIFNRVIWSKSDNWRPRRYTGSNAHDQHGHFSGDPLYDEDDSRWSILSFLPKPAPIGVDEMWFAQVKGQPEVYKTDGFQAKWVTGPNAGDNLKRMMNAGFKYVSFNTLEEMVLFTGPIQK